MRPVGATIRQWRLQKGLRQEDVEAATGVTQEYLSSLESGKIKEPGLAKVAKIVHALGYTLNDLVSERDEEVARRRPAVVGAAA